MIKTFIFLIFTSISKIFSEELQEKKDKADLDLVPKSFQMETKNKNTIFRFKIGGYFDGQGGFALNQPTYFKDEIMPNGLSYVPQALRQSRLTFGTNYNIRAKIDFNPELEDKYGNKFGVFIAFPFHKNDTDPKTASQEYLYFDFPYARIEVGSVFSSASKLRIDPSKIASGTGGIYGDWWRYSMLPIYNISGLSSANGNAVNFGYAPVFMIYPTLPNEAGATVPNTLGGAHFNGSIQSPANVLFSSSNQFYPTQGARSNKISIYSKRVKDFQLGFSYSPNTMQTGFMNSYSQSIALNTFGGGVVNYFSSGINYKKQINDDFAIALSFTHEYGQYFSPRSNYSNNGVQYVGILKDNAYFNRNNLNAFALGMQLSYRNFALSYSYGYWGKSLQAKGAILTDGSVISPKNSYYHAAGVAFNFGPINFGVQYMNSNYAGNKLDLVSIGTDFKITGIKYIRIEPYFEYNYFQLNPRILLFNISNDAIKAMRVPGHVIILGTRFIF